MEEKQLGSILLSYEIENRVLNDYYKYFLKMLGVFVWDEVKKKTDEFDIIFDIQAKKELEDDFIVKPDKLNNLRKILELQVGKEYFNDWYDELIRIYDKYNLFEASVTLENFTLSSKEVLEAGKNFEKAADELLELTKNNNNYYNNRHMRYAKVYCKERANLGQFTYDKSYTYYLNHLTLEGDEIIEQFCKNKDEYFYFNIFNLIGDINYISSADFPANSLRIYEYIARTCKNKKYISDSYCKCGNIFFNIFDKSSRIFFEKSLKNFINYKNSLKYGYIQFLNGNNEEAIKCCDNCLNIIKEKEKNITPSEILSYFNTLKLKMKIYNILNDNQNVIRYGLELIELRKKIIEGIEKSNEYTNYCHQIYNNDQVKDYIKLILNQINLKDIYILLGESYKNLNLNEEAKKYQFYI